MGKSRFHSTAVCPRLYFHCSVVTSMVRFQIFQTLVHYQDLDIWAIYKYTNGSAGMVEFSYCRAEDIAATYFIASGGKWPGW